MPDDERLGGTHDPHERGRRHRRDDPPPAPAAPEEQPRRRRRSVESGGVSVADLVQRHTESRQNLTPVNPDQMRQNSLMTGRRARQEDPPQGRQNAEPPAGPRHPSISAALDGGFPLNEPAQPSAEPHRPGGTSSYFTIPSEALRDGLAPTDEAPGFPADERRHAGEGSGPRRAPEPPPGFPPEAAEPAPRRPRPRPRKAPAPQDGFPPEADGPRRRAGAAFPTDAPNGFPPDDHRGGQAGDPHFPGEAPRNSGRRVGEASAHFQAPNGFPPDVDGPRGNGARRAGDGHFPSEAPNGFPPDVDGPRRNGSHRAGETSAHFPADAFPPDADQLRRNGTRRPGEASAHFQAPNGFPPEVDGPRRNGSRHAGDAPNGFPPDVDGPPRNGGRRVGEASAHFPTDAPNGVPPNVDGPRRTGRRRVGEASAQFMAAPNGFPPPDVDGSHGTRHAADAPNAFAPEVDGPRRNGSRHAGDGHFAAEAPNGFPPDDRRSRHVGEASAPRNIPGDGFPPDDRRNGRRGGEAHGIPGVGEASAHHRLPGDGFPPGEASAHHSIPGRPGEGPHGFPGETSGPREALGRRPEGAARRRAARAAAPQPEPGRFPTDAPPPQPGQASGHFPIDDPRRQGRPMPGELSEPRLTPAAIDAPDTARPPRPGVPPVPLPPPRRTDDDLISMTTEMEAIGEEVQKRRTIDHTLARFSAVHDEIKAEEREKKAKRRKLRPWERGDEEMDRLDELEAQQSMAMVIPTIPEDDEEPEDEEPDEQPKKKRRWLKGKFAGKAFAVVVAALVFLSTAVAWGFKSYVENSAQTVDALDPDSDAIQDAAAQLGDENFLLVGSDTRAGATAEDGVGDEGTVEGARSDTVMIAHVPKNRERVVVVSFPRDLEVTRPACEGWDPKTGQSNGEQHPAAERVKLNTAYQVGGPKCVTKLVQELSGLAVNHFVGIDFHGFKDMVEAVQGVEVCVERPLDDEVLGLVVPEAGKNVKISGDQALNFVRARHVKGDPTSDYGRITRQQRFLSSLLRKAMSSEVLLNPGKLTKFVDAFSKSTFGDNIGIDQLFTLGQSMQGVEAGRVTFITIPTVGEANNRGNEELRSDDATQLFEAIRQDTPLPGEAPAKTDGQQQSPQQQSGLVQQQQTQQQPAGPVDPKTIKLQVLNGGNDQDGIAGEAADDLAEYGFEILRVGKADPVDKTIIKYSKSREAQAQTVKAAVPGATLVEDRSMSGAIMLIIGPEFDGTVQSPTGGGAVAEVPDGLSTVNAGDVSCA